MPDAENFNNYGENKVFFSWEIPEFVEHNRSFLWYVVAVIIAVALVVYSIIVANYLFALIIILVAFIVFLRSYSQAANLLFQITEDGISIGNQFFKYDQFRSFYIIYDPPAVKKIFFQLKGVQPAISVLLYNKNPLLIREKLLEYIKEDYDNKTQGLDDQLETILKL